MRGMWRRIGALASVGARAGEMALQTRRGVAALGAAGLVSACASLAAPAAPKLAPVNVSRERVIRVDVGLRPYRKSGFRVAREALGEKTIVHNYGHGGAGVKHLVAQGIRASQADAVMESVVS